jgi:catalase-peroxidase
MGMNDRETVALTVGGHTFGKMHGAVPDDTVGEAPEAAKLQELGFGWSNTHETGFGEYTITSGLEGAWTPTPTKWDNSYLDTIFAHEWEVKRVARRREAVGAGRGQGRLLGPRRARRGQEEPAGDDRRRHGDDRRPGLPRDLQGVPRAPGGLADEFARAWYKLLHRDMGPRERYLGPDVPDEVLVWQDPVPEHEGPLVGDAEISTLKQQIADSGLTAAQLVGPPGRRPRPTVRPTTAVAPTARGSVSSRWSAGTSTSAPAWRR